jgi:hypothetical protein
VDFYYRVGPLVPSSNPGREAPQSFPISGPLKLLVSCDKPLAQGFRLSSAPQASSGLRREVSRIASDEGGFFIHRALRPASVIPFLASIQVLLTRLIPQDTVGALS